MTFRRPSVLLFVLVSLVLSPSFAAAQNVGGTLSGIIQDASGGSVQGAVIAVVHAETALARTAASDDAGRYRLVGLTPGDYAFDVRVPGFAVHRQQVQIGAGQTLVRDIQLQIAGGHEEIQVAASQLQRESSELGGIVQRDLVLGLPVNGRSYEQLTLLEPGVVSTTTRETRVLYQHGLKININGASSRSNAFLLDGTSVTDLYNNGLGSAAGTFLGLEAVREFQVLTNAYEAAYGGVSGGIVSIITKSGSRQFHGSAFGAARDGRLDAKNYFDVEKPDFWRRQWGGSLGGPLVRDRAVFFVTGEWLRESMGLTQVTTVPSLAARSGALPDPLRPGFTVPVSLLVAPFLDLFPLPNGRDLGDGLAEHRFVATRPTRDAFGQARVDLGLGSGNSLFARLTVDDSGKVEPARYPGTAVDWNSTSRFATLEDSHVFSPGAFNTARLSYSFTDIAQTDTTGRGLNEELALVAGRGIPHLVIGGMPAFGSLVSPYTHARQRLLSFSEELALSKGSHLVKLGTLVEHFDALVDFQIFWPGRYSFPDVRQFLQARPSVLSLALPGSESLRQLSSNQLAMYAQDDVKLSSRLTLNAGVRWEFATAPKEEQGRLVGVPDPVNDRTLTVGSLLRTEKANLAPRVGAAWTPFADGRTVVRGGAGLFYDINTLPFIAQTVGTNPPFYNQVTIRNPVFRRSDLPAATVLSLGIPQYDWRTPRLWHFNAAIERELPGRTMLSVAYAGSRGSHLVRSGDINAPVADILADGTRVFAAGRPRRNPAFGAIDYRAPDGQSRYDALQLKIARRFQGSVQFQASYTLGRTIDQSQGTVPTEANGSVTARMDPDFSATDRGPADYDRRHNLTAYLLWATPRLTGAPAVLRHALSGWTVSGILAMRSGNPFTVGIQEDYSRTLARVSVDRPNLRPGVDPDQIVLGGANLYFDPSAFVLQAPGTFGNVGRNSLTGPGLATLDMSFARPVVAAWPSRASQLQLRLDAFNLLNRVNLGMPQRIVFAGVRQDEAPISSAGRITSTTTGPRELQLSLRLSW
ncbi:MAG: TonB-dependent receptor [Vicinamibacterales bacterium]